MYQLPDKYKELVKRALEPPPRLTPAQWAERELILPPQVTNKAGPLRLQPWFVEIINNLDDPKLESITVSSGAQIGKTTLEIIAMAYCLCVWDSPALVVFPTQEQAESLLRRRAMPIFKASKSLNNIVKADRDHKSSLEIFGINSSVKAGWAGSAASLSSVPCKMVLIDEVAKMGDSVGEEADAVSLATARVATYRNQGSKVFCVSTPVYDHGVFYNQYNKGIIHHWGFKCSCGMLSLPNFQRLKWPKDSPFAQIESGAVEYQCEHCEKRYKEREYRVAIRNGMWVVNDPLVEAKSSNHKSYWLTGLMSDNYTFGFLVKEFLVSKDNPSNFQHVMNSYFGEFWAEKRVEMKESSLQKLVTDEVALVVPPETMRLVAGLDVGGQGGLEPDEQGKVLHFWVTLLAIHPASRATMIFSGRFAGWKATMEFLQKDFYSPSEDRIFRLTDAYCDSGYMTDLIYGIALKTPGIIACDGMPSMREPTKGISVDSSSSSYGRKKFIGGTIIKQNISTLFFKDKIWSMIANEQLHFNQELHPDTFKHITSEIKKPIKTSRGYEWRYVVKYDRVENHILDCLVYALASSYVGGDYKFNSYEEWNLINTPPPQPVPAQVQQSQPQLDPYRGTGVTPNWGTGGISPY